MSGLSNAMNIARSGINTIAGETAASSRNITGATTGNSNYSRKTANVVTTSDGSSQVASVTRAQNQAVFDNMLDATSASATQDALSAGLTTLNQTVGDVSDDSSDASSMAALLGNLSDALQSYEGSPSDSTLAGAAVSAADALADGLNSASATVQQVREQADSDMQSSVQTINSLLQQFQTVNTQIVNGTALGSDVSDLQDTRDGILKQLSQQIGITTTTSANGDTAIYTDSGATMFQGGLPRTVTMAPTNTYTPGTTGNAVFVDGVPVTGSGATMPITSGALAGLATLRDQTTVTYQNQLDSIAGALINTFSESDPSGGGGADLAGLFTSSGSSTLPTSTTGLAGTISVNAKVDPSQGGNASLLRDGINYTYNTNGDASFTGQLSQMLTNLSQTQTFSGSGGITTSASLSSYASASVSWLEAQRSTVSSQSDYQSTLLSTATTALSNSTGVNLDDEMSKMLDIENSYAASAKLITAIDSMFTGFLSDMSSITA